MPAVTVKGHIEKEFAGGAWHYVLVAVDTPPFRGTHPYVKPVSFFVMPEAFLGQWAAHELVEITVASAPVLPAVEPLTCEDFSAGKGK